MKMLLLLFLVLVPMAMAGTYGANHYGSGVYGIGEVIAEPDTEGGGGTVTLLIQQPNGTLVLQNETQPQAQPAPLLPVLSWWDKIVAFFTPENKIKIVDSQTQFIKQENVQHPTEPQQVTLITISKTKLLIYSIALVAIAIILIYSGAWPAVLAFAANPVFIIIVILTGIIYILLKMRGLI